MLQTTKDTNINIRLSSALKEALHEAAAEEQQTLSDFVIAALSAYVYSSERQQDKAVLHVLQTQNTAFTQALAIAEAQIKAYETLATTFLPQLIGTTYTHNGKTHRIETPYDVLRATSIHIKLSIKQ